VPPSRVAVFVKGEGPLTVDYALSWGICGPLICTIYTLRHTGEDWGWKLMSSVRVITHDMEIVQNSAIILILNSEM
jgi:hypothetical protein